jgi:hypothetical protein
MKNTIKRVAATVAIAGAMLIGAQGVASAEETPDPVGNVSQTIKGLGILNGIVVQDLVDVHHNNIAVNVLGVLGQLGNLGTANEGADLLGR